MLQNHPRFPLKHPLLRQSQSPCILLLHSSPIALNAPAWSPTVAARNASDKLLPALDAAYNFNDKEDDNLPFKYPPPPPQYNLRSRQNIDNIPNSNIKTRSHLS
jgi:hypothetical protein